MGLAHDVHEAERRVAARQVALHARVAALRAGWRDRINPRALLLVGAAAGFALQQILAYRSNKPVVYEVAPDSQPRKKPKKPSAVMRLLPLAHLAAASWLEHRRADDQSPRSMSRADHSVKRTGNGLSRH